MEKRFVFEFAPKGFVCVDGKYALMSEPIEVVSPYDDTETVLTALAVDMSEKVINNRWAETYRCYWFKGDRFNRPSIIGKENIMVEISSDIFARKVS